MRWEGLFADLESQAAALDAASRAAEIEERSRLEVGRISLLDRLGATAGAPVRVRCSGGVTVAGRLERAAPDWLLLDEGGREALVVLACVLGVSGLARLASVPADSVVESRLGLRQALRGVARDRSTVRITLVDGNVVDGTIDRIGADFAEVAEHAPGELRRHGEVRDILALPLAAIAVVRRVV